MSFLIGQPYKNWQIKGTDKRNGAVFCDQMELSSGRTIDQVDWASADRGGYLSSRRQPRHIRIWRQEKRPSIA